MPSRFLDKVPQYIKPLTSIMTKPPPARPPVENATWCDRINLSLGELTIIVERYSKLPVPHEVSAIVPRVEIRRSVKKEGEFAASSEVLLNSITVVHAPRHPPAGESKRRINIKYQ